MESLVHILLSNALAATLMAAVIAVVGRTCRRPALTHSLWLVVMLKLVTPPLVPVSLPFADILSRIGPSPAISHVDHNVETAAQINALADFDSDESTSRRSDELVAAVWADPGYTEPNFAGTAANVETSNVADEHRYTRPEESSSWMWEPLVLVVVLAGALVWWTIAAVRIIRFQRLLQDVPPAPEEWQSHTKLIAEQMDLSWCPSVCLVPGRVPPMLWAIGGRPRLLVPSTLWIEMGDDERTSLLLHELAHLKRRDHWVRWLEITVAGLYWWHPIVWWIRRALREAEEQCCDAWVVSAMPNQARTYAAALLAAVEFVSGARPAPAAASATSGSGHVSCLKRRLKMIVRAKTPKGLSWAGRITVLGMTALLLPLAPSWAQKSETEQANKERRDSLRSRAEAGRSDDRDTLALEKQFGTEHLAYLRKDLLEVQSQKRKAQARLEAEPKAEPQAKQELTMLNDLEKRLTDEIRLLDKENQSLVLNMRVLKEIQDANKKGDAVDNRIAEELKKDADVLALKKEL